MPEPGAQADDTERTPPRPTAQWLRDDPPSLEAGGDAFHIKTAVEGLSKLLVAADPPFVIGLTGEWGTGKTTFAQAVCANVATTMDTCWVDLWSQDISELRRTLLIEVGSAGAEDLTAARIEQAGSLDSALRTSSSTIEPPELKLSPVIKPTRKNVLRPVWGVLLLVLIIELILFLDILPGTKTLVPLASTVLGAIIVFAVLNSGLVVRVRSTQRSIAPAKESVQLHDAFRAIVRQSEHHRPVLVVVDNLDRLPADDALRTLSEIRAFVEMQDSRCLFLIPVDRDALTSQLKHVLRDDRAARDYLDKFFNLDLAVSPPVAPDLRQWTLDRASRIFPRLEPLRPLVQVVNSAARGNPRAITRILNGTLTRSMLLPEGTAEGGLDSVAFIEAITLRFPKVMKRLDQHPRLFIELRETMAAASIREQRAVALADFLDIDELGDLEQDALDFLSSNMGVPLDQERLTEVLSLRAVEAWERVPGGQELQKALEVGDDESFATVFVSIDLEVRDRALEQSLDLIDSSLRQRYLRDAANGLNALAAQASESTVRIRAQSAAYEAFGTPDTIGTANAGVVALVFGADAPKNRAAVLWQLAVARLAADPAPSQRLLSLVSAGALHVTTDDCRSAQPAIALAANRGLDIAPLFEAGPPTCLVDREVADYVAGLLSSWKQPSMTDTDVIQLVDRLDIALRAGWAGAALTVVAGQVTSDVVAGVTPTDWSKLRTLSGLLASAPASTEIDDLASALVPLATPSDGLPIRLALALPLSASGASAIGSETNSWLASASSDSTLALVRESGEALRRHSIDISVPIAARWTSGDGQDFLQAIAELAGGPLRDVVAAALTGATATWYLALEAAGVVESRDDRAALEEVALFVDSSLVPPLPTPQPFREVLKILHGEGISLNDSVSRLTSTISSLTTNDGLDRAAELAPDVAGTNREWQQRLANALAERCIALGHLPRSEEEWIVRGSRRVADLAAVVATEASSMSAAEAIDRVRPLRGVLSHSGKVGLALLELAAGETVDCSEALLLTAEARQWTHGFRGRKAEVEAALDKIGECEGSGEAIGAVRARL